MRFNSFEYYLQVCLRKPGFKTLIAKFPDLSQIVSESKNYVIVILHNHRVLNKHDNLLYINI